MRISQQSIQQITQTADIVEVVSDFVTLKKRGANYAALSPFTNEKSASFYVSPSKQIFKCFSTTKGGDAIKFVMELDKLTYVEALKYLAKKYNIEIIYDKVENEDLDKAAQSERDSLYIIMEYAKNYYKNILVNHPDGKAIGKTYFTERGINDKTITDFELGFALDGWDNLIKDAEKNQFSLELLQKSGVIKNSENNKTFDFFRNRVMYPIHNLTGKTIALAGRILGSDKGTAKYLNSPETDLFKKSEILYGLFQAKQSIRSMDVCLLVEGYMDVLSLYQAGITNAVASAGTALTESQIKLIARYTKNVTVLYDGDKAGIKAAIRSTDLLLDSGLNIKVLIFPDGEDPDSYVNKVGSTEFINFLEKNSKDFISFKTEILLKDVSGDPIKKAEVIHEIVISISKIRDDIQRTLYLKMCSQMLDIDEQVIVSEYNKIKLGEIKKKQVEADKNEQLPTDDQIKENENSKDSLIFLYPLDSNSLAEQEIVRILLEYAEEQMDEDKNVCQFLFSYLENIQFEDPVFLQIIEVFKTELKENKLPTLNYFINFPDKIFEERLTTLLTDKHNLSDVWFDKYQIYVPKKDNDRTGLVNKSLARLNFEKLRKRLKENDIKLRNVSFENIEETDNLLQENIVVKQYQQMYAKELGMIISG
ncbi:MAG: DNA primase [Cytophagales bacterium]|nr:MAG: DNA primase [Cytophagales bacterium]